PSWRTGRSCSPYPPPFRSGGAVLGFVVADLLFREFPAFDEGHKSKLKASLVSTTTLARQAERLGLGDHLLLGRGEEKTGGRRKPERESTRPNTSPAGDSDV